jgi:hypothetical protein
MIYATYFFDYETSFNKLTNFFWNLKWLWYVFRKKVKHIFRMIRNYFFAIYLDFYRRLFFWKLSFFLFAFRTCRCSRGGIFIWDDCQFWSPLHLIRLLNMSFRIEFIQYLLVSLFNHVILRFPNFQLLL